MDKLLWTIFIVVALSSSSYGMSCSYGERGSLTVYCTNVTSSIYFRSAPYRFDHLDETLKCLNCTLGTLDSGVFDISGNQIKTLDLRGSYVTKISYKAFIGLIFMEKLLLSNNSITSIYPGAFVGVRKVKYLELENAISNLSPDVFQELRILEVLILKRNNISTLYKGTFSGLDYLKILDLSFNRLSNLNNSFDPLVSLRILRLQTNQITRIYGDEFNSLKALLMLNLENNLLTHFAININSDNYLRILNLSKNNLDAKGIKIGAFQNLNNLEELDLSYNSFTNIPAKFFQGLYRLRILNLAGNNINEFTTGTFTGLPHLLTLNVSNNGLETAKVSGRLLLHSLHTLDLSNNNIKDFDYLDFISRAPRITTVLLLNNDLSCETISDINVLFKEDGLRFFMNNFDEDSSVCKPTSQSPQEIIVKLLSKKYKKEDRSSALTVWIILTTIVILLVGLLFYIQFIVLNRNRRPFL